MKSSIRLIEWSFSFIALHRILFYNPGLFRQSCTFQKPLIGALSAFGNLDDRLRINSLQCLLPDALQLCRADYNCFQLLVPVKRSRTDLFHVPAQRETFFSAMEELLSLILP